MVSDLPSPTQEQARNAEKIRRAWDVLSSVLDPEVPVVSVRDLGIVRDVQTDGEGLEVVVTPTYSGCPATELIDRSICEALEAEHLGPVRIKMQRSPAWTTDWISEEGRRKLREYGIAPPTGTAAVKEAPLVFMKRATQVSCPRCGSTHTERLSAFGSTACKSLYRCLSCREPFEYFKPI
jgi:ring-1,2-phenylacetyl-CoA epoxidase subunit PaaD